MIKTYSSRLYQNVITVDGFAILMDLLKQTGHINKMIEAYPTLARSKEAYEQIVEHVIQGQ